MLPCQIWMIQNVLSEGGPTLTFFKLMRGEGIQIPLLAGQHRPANETPFNGVFASEPMVTNDECWHCSFVIFQGIRTSIAKKPYTFVIFQGGPGPPTPPPPASGSAHVYTYDLSGEMLIPFGTNQSDATSLAFSPS